MRNQRRGPGIAWLAVTVVFLLAGCGSSSEPGAGPGEIAGGGGAIKAARPGVAGITFTEVLIDVMQHDLDSFDGWRPNDLLYGKIFDNCTNEELGHLAVLRESVEILKEDIARRGALDDFVPDLVKAQEAFDSDPYKWWRPSAGSRMQEGVTALKSYRDQLIQGEAGFFPRPDNLAHLLDHDVTLLGDLHKRLVGRVGFFKTDNEFYYSRGAAAGMARLYAAMERDFAPEIQARGLEKLMEEARASLELAAKMHPWIVLDGGDDSFRANHRLNMAAHLAEARTKSFLVLEALKQPPPQ